MPDLPEVLPAGTRYTANGVECELLGPSTLRANGTYTVPARRYVATGVVSPEPVEAIAACQWLELTGPVVLPGTACSDALCGGCDDCLRRTRERWEAKHDPYAEHRRKIGDDK